MKLQQMRMKLYKNS